MRIGHGYDVHAFAQGRKLILGGKEIPHEKGLLGHSDADVLTHAVMDSILGALCAGDIGHLFPDNDPAYAGADSIKLCEKVAELMRLRGYEIVNIDATVIAQRPKLAPYIDAMREAIAASLSTSVENVSIKATTEEHLGFTGREEGIAAHCVCLIEKKGTCKNRMQM